MSGYPRRSQSLRRLAIENRAAQRLESEEPPANTPNAPSAASGANQLQFQWAESPDLNTITSPYYTPTRALPADRSTWFTRPDDDQDDYEASVEHVEDVPQAEHRDHVNHTGVQNQSIRPALAERGNFRTPTRNSPLSATGAPRGHKNVQPSASGNTSMPATSTFTLRPRNEPQFIQPPSYSQTPSPSGFNQGSQHSRSTVATSASASHSDSPTVFVLRPRNPAPETVTPNNQSHLNPESPPFFPSSPTRAPAPSRGESSSS
ncbi:hypothetical protein V8F33_002640 [Rhypophila sp. PSN 637]